jgi:fluoride exporter
MRTILVIGLGGAIGSISRYLIGGHISRLLATTFPAGAVVGTFVVNITGCFIIGLLFGLANRHAWLTLEWRLFLITGICGGYTTFSSFSYESIQLFRQGNYLYFLMYVLFSVIVGLLATVGGAALAR